MRLTKEEKALDSFHFGDFRYAKYSPTTRKALRKLDHAQFYLRRQYYSTGNQGWIDNDRPQMQVCDYVDSANILNDARNAVYAETTSKGDN